MHNCIILFRVYCQDRIGLEDENFIPPDPDKVIRTMVGKANSAAMIAGPDHPVLKDWKGTLELGMLFAAGGWA